MSIDPSINSNHEYSITKDYLKANKPITKNGFKQFINEKLKTYNETSEVELKTKTLSERLGISYEMFRKILNKEKPTKKRDCIIAICFEIQLELDDIDEALRLYNYMPALNTADPRDDFIMDQIPILSPFPSKELNERLLQNGFPELDIHDSRNKNRDSKQMPVINSRYSEYELKVSAHIGYENYYGDQYNSLCTTYDPSQCLITGKMALLDAKTKDRIFLFADSSGYRYAKAFRKDRTSRAGEKTKIKLNRLSETVENIDDYKSYYIRLEKAISSEKRKLLHILDDTKNYSSRVSARIIDDSITIFAEQFSYAIPELEEYYLIALSSGKCRLYVYDKSAFMAWYLGEAKYKSCYRTKLPVPVETYESIEEIQSECELDEYLSTIEKRLRNRIRLDAYKQLKPLVDKLYQELKNREVFIQNLEYIYENPAEVLAYYKIETDYECKRDDDTGEICDCLSSREYSLPDGTVVMITLDDLYRAFELGFSDIQEICRIKAKLSSIEAVLW